MSDPPNRYDIGKHIEQMLNEARSRTFLDAAELVDHLAKGYASDPHQVRCRHIATELRAWAARTGSISNG